jgi:hypothetical protein
MSVSDIGIKRNIFETFGVSVYLNMEEKTSQQWEV